jgi:hypothetical protein
MPDTFIKIASVAVGSGGAATMAFSSIPSTYTHLVLVTSNRLTGSNPTVNLRFNSDTTQTNYYRKILLNYGAGVSTNSTNDQGGAGYATYSGYTASTFASTSILIPNYLSANQKSYSADSVAENNSASDYFSGIFAGLWNGTAAITGITIYPADSTNWVQYSTATLYGIKNL